MLIERKSYQMRNKKIYVCTPKTNKMKALGQKTENKHVSNDGERVNSCFYFKIFEAITNEMIKYGGQELVKEITILLQKILRTVNILEHNDRGVGFSHGL
jgi:hypothetical protein